MMAWINWLDLLSVIWSLVSSTMREFLIDRKWSKPDYALTNTVRKRFASLKSRSNLDFKRQMRPFKVHLSNSLLLC